MKLTVDRLSLLKVLNIVNIAIGQKSPTPAFLNFKFEMKDVVLEVTGSNNDLTICSTLPIKDGDTTLITAFTKGATLISSKFLLEIVRRLEGQFITIEVIDDVIAKISDEKSDFKLNSMRIQDYPDLDLEISGDSVTFKAEEFKKIVSQTAFAASTKEVRPVLTTINITASGNEMEFLTTDSFRLSKKIYETEESHDFVANIPVKTMNEVAKLIEDGDVTMTVSKRKVVFTYKNTTIYSRLIDADFPKVGRMIPDTYPYVLQINSEAFMAAISRASLLAIERENIVKISINVNEENQIEVSSKSDQIGSATETITDFRFVGDSFVISFNVNFVLDAIKAAQSEDVILSFAGEMSAFRVTSPVDKSIIQVITPVRSYY